MLVTNAGYFKVNLIDFRVFVTDYAWTELIVEVGTDRTEEQRIPRIGNTHEQKFWSESEVCS